MPRAKTNVGKRPPAGIARKRFDIYPAPENLLTKTIDDRRESEQINGTARDDFARNMPSATR